MSKMNPHNHFKANIYPRYIIIIGLVVVFLGNVVVFQNCGNNRGVKSLPSDIDKAGIKRDLREDLPFFPEDIDIGTEDIGDRIGTVVASWDQESTLISCSGSSGRGSNDPAPAPKQDDEDDETALQSATNSQEVAIDGGCTEDIYTYKEWETHPDLHPTVPDVNTPITLKLLHSSNKKASQFEWSVIRDNVHLIDDTTDTSEYTYAFTEPGVYDISVTSISGDEWFSHSNKRLIVGNDCRLSTPVIPEIAITEGALKWGEKTTFTLQNNHLQSEIFGFEDISWGVIKNSSQRKSVQGSFPPSSESGGEFSGNGESITIDLPAKNAASDIIDSINVYLSATTTIAQNQRGRIACNPPGSCPSSEPEVEILSCQSHRSKGFNLAEFTNSDGNEKVEGSGPYFVSVQPYVWAKDDIISVPAICELPPGCDDIGDNCGCVRSPRPFPPPSFTLKRLTLESHDIYRYSRKPPLYSSSVTTTSLFMTTTSSSIVTTTTQANSQPKEHLAFLNAHIVGASNCSYNISYSHRTAEQGTFDCGAISDVSHTLEDPSDTYTPAGGGWIPFTLDMTRDCQEAIITIRADDKERTYYNYCPKFYNYNFVSDTAPSLEYYYTHNCYFGPIAQRSERHSCNFEYPIKGTTPTTRQKPLPSGPTTTQSTPTTIQGTPTTTQGTPTTTQGTPTTTQGTPTTTQGTPTTTQGTPTTTQGTPTTTQGTPTTTQQ